MSTHHSAALALADWETIGLKLLVFTRYWARTHYGWRSDRPLPGGKTPEDIVCDVYAAFVSGQRALNAAVPVEVQLKGAVRSLLWNLHRARDADTQTVAPVDLESLGENGNLAADVESADFCAEFWRQLYAEPQLQRSADLRACAQAIESGAETVEEICARTTLPVAQVYELRRRLKAIAEKIIHNLYHEGAPHEHRGENQYRTSASTAG